MREIIKNLSFDSILTEDVDNQAENLINILTDLREEYVVHKNHTVKPTDKTCFGQMCRNAADAKKAWSI